MKTKNAQRQAKFKARMIKLGLVQVNVWATPEARVKIEKLALDSRCKVIEQLKEK